jgi:hypothetical protein
MNKRRRDNNEITRRHDLLALRGGKTFKKRKSWRTPKSSHNRSLKGNPLGEKLSEPEGNEMVEWIWRISGGNHQWSGWSGGAAAMEEEHGWWGRKKKEVGLNRSHQPPI